MRVLALYPDGDEDVINAQLLFYAAAARHSLPEFFAGVENIVLTILQPQSIEPDAEMVSSVEVTHAELDEFIAVYPRGLRGGALGSAAAGTGRLVPLSARRNRSARSIPSRCSISPSSWCRPPAQGLTTCRCSLAAWTLVDAVKDIGTALHDQAKRSPRMPATSCPATRSRPAAPSAIGAMMSLLR